MNSSNETDADKAKRRALEKSNLLKEFYLSEENFCDELKVFTANLKKYRDSNKMKFSSTELAVLNYIITVYEEIAKSPFQKNSGSPPEEQAEEIASYFSDRNETQKNIINRFYLVYPLHDMMSDFLDYLNKKIVIVPKQLNTIKVNITDKDMPAIPKGTLKEHAQYLSQPFQRTLKYPLFLNELISIDGKLGVTKSIFTNPASNCQEAINKLDSLTKPAGVDPQDQENQPTQQEVIFPILQAALQSKLIQLNANPEEVDKLIKKLLDYGKRKTRQRESSTLFKPKDIDTIIPNILLELSTKNSRTEMLEYLDKKISANKKNYGENFSSLLYQIRDAIYIAPAMEKTPDTSTPTPISPETNPTTADTNNADLEQLKHQAFTLDEFFKTERTYCSHMQKLHDHVQRYRDSRKDTLTAAERTNLEFLIDAYKNAAAPLFPDFPDLIPNPAKYTGDANTLKVGIAARIQALSKLYQQYEFPLKMQKRFSISPAISASDKIDMFLRESGFFKGDDLLKITQDYLPQATMQRVTRLKLILDAVRKETAAIAVPLKVQSVITNTVNSQQRDYTSAIDNPDFNLIHFYKKLNELHTPLALENYISRKKPLEIPSLNAANKLAISIQTSKILASNSKQEFKDRLTDYLVFLPQLKVKIPPQYINDLKEFITLLNRPDEVYNESQRRQYRNYIATFVPPKNEDRINRELDNIEKMIANHQPCYAELQILHTHDFTKDTIGKSKSLSARLDDLQKKSAEVMSMSLTAKDKALFTQLDFNEFSHNPASGCEIALNNTPPTLATLKNYLTTSNSAYILCAHQLYYINNARKTCTEISMTPAALESFTSKLRPGKKARKLSDKELSTILDITRFTPPASLTPTRDNWTKFFNQTSEFVIADILERSNLAERTDAIEYWINVARQCHTSNTLPDINMAQAIFGALQESSISRLIAKNADDVTPNKSHLSPNVKEDLDVLTNLLSADKNFANQKNFYAQNSKCIPYPGTTLTALVMLNENMALAKDKDTKNSETIRTNLINALRTHSDTVKPIELIPANAAIATIISDIPIHDATLLDEKNWKASNKLLPPKAAAPAAHATPPMTPNKPPLSEKEKAILDLLNQISSQIDLIATHYDRAATAKAPHTGSLFNKPKQPSTTPGESTPTPSDIPKNK